MLPIFAFAPSSSSKGNNLSDAIQLFCAHLSAIIAQQSSQVHSLVRVRSSATVLFSKRCASIEGIDRNRSDRIGSHLWAACASRILLLFDGVGDAQFNLRAFQFTKYTRSQRAAKTEVKVRANKTNISRSQLFDCDVAIVSSSFLPLGRDYKNEDCASLIQFDLVRLP